MIRQSDSDPIDQSEGVDSEAPVVLATLAEYTDKLVAACEAYEVEQRRDGIRRLGLAITLLSLAVGFVVYVLYTTGGIEAVRRSNQSGSLPALITGTLFLFVAAFRFEDLFRLLPHSRPLPLRSTSLSSLRIGALANGLNRVVIRASKFHSAGKLSGRSLFLLDIRLGEAEAALHYVRAKYDLPAPAPASVSLPSKTHASSD